MNLRKSWFYGLDFVKKIHLFDAALSKSELNVKLDLFELLTT
jgi:hypothetical protein